MVSEINLKVHLNRMEKYYKGWNVYEFKIPFSLISVLCLKRTLCRSYSVADEVPTLSQTLEKLNFVHRFELTKVPIQHLIIPGLTLHYESTATRFQRKHQYISLWLFMQIGL